MPTLTSGRDIEIVELSFAEYSRLKDRVTTSAGNTIGKLMQSLSGQGDGSIDISDMLSQALPGLSGLIDHITPWLIHACVREGGKRVEIDNSEIRGWSITEVLESRDLVVDAIDLNGLVVAEGKFVSTLLMRFPAAKAYLDASMKLGRSQDSPDASSAT